MDENEKIFAYRRAGELSGRLLQSLGFGNLQVKFKERSVIFEWTFKARQQPYLLYQEVALIELALMLDVPLFASKMCEKWKEFHRQQSVEPPRLLLDYLESLDGN